MKLLTILIVVCLVIVYGFVQSGIFNVAATVKDGPLITWILQTTMKKSVERRARSIEVPDINNNEMILAGMSDYVGMCAQCHGEPDKPNGILTEGLNPSPPNLEHLTEARTAAEMFWIINNGIRMTGMPAFGKTHQADEIWPVVAFLQSAKAISNTEYNRLKKEAEAYGHHKTESSMDDKGNGQHHPDGVDVTHEVHGADTPPTVTSDSQISDIPSLHQEEEPVDPVEKQTTTHDHEAH